MKKQFKIFISSVQDEFAAERKLLKKWLWYLREMSYRKKKAALPLTTTPQELMTHLGLLNDGVYTWAAALCFAKNPQRWCYRATLKCSWCEGREFTRPFLDTDKFEGNLFELQKTGVDFVMSRIAQSRGLRETGMQAPVRAEIPREAVEEALVNACKKNKNPIPEFRQEGSMFVVTLKKRSVARAKTTTLKTTQQTTQQTTQEAMTVRVLQGVLQGNALRVALYLLQNPKAKIEKVMQEIQLTRDGVNYHLRQLKATVGLRREGALQDSVWKFVLPKRLLRRVTK